MSDHKPVPGTLLALDPSSTCTGWAAFDPAGNPTAFGVLRPRSTLPALARIDETTGRLRTLLMEHAPAVVVVEWSDGRVAGRMRGFSGYIGAGLATLGQAQGAIRQVARDLGHEVVEVAANDWTRRAGKQDRAARLALQVPEYGAFRAAGRDRGLDAADALGLGLWYFGRIREAELLRRAEAEGGAVAVNGIHTKGLPPRTARRGPRGRRPA